MVTWSETWWFVADDNPVTFNSINMEVPDVRWINFQLAQCKKVALTGPVRLYISSWETHTRVHLEIRLAKYARALVRSLAFQRRMEGCRYVCTLLVERREVPIAVPLYPANWNFSPRIEFFRQNHEALRYTRDVPGVTLRGRIIHTQCDSSKRGYATDRISVPVWISRDVFSETNAICPRCRDIS